MEEEEEKKKKEEKRRKGKKTHFFGHLLFTQHWSKCFICNLHNNQVSSETLLPLFTDEDTKAHTGRSLLKGTWLVWGAEPWGRHERNLMLISEMNDWLADSPALGQRWKLWVGLSLGIKWHHLSWGWGTPLSLSSSLSDSLSQHLFSSPLISCFPFNFPRSLWFGN